MAGPVAVVGTSTGSTAGSVADSAAGSAAGSVVVSASAGKRKRAAAEGVDEAPRNDAALLEAGLVARLNVLRSARKADHGLPKYTAIADFDASKTKTTKSELQEVVAAYDVDQTIEREAAGKVTGGTVHKISVDDLADLARKHLVTARTANGAVKFSDVCKDMVAKGKGLVDAAEAVPEAEMSADEKASLAAMCEQDKNRADKAKVKTFRRLADLDPGKLDKAQLQIYADFLGLQPNLGEKEKKKVTREELLLLVSKHAKPSALTQFKLGLKQAGNLVTGIVAPFVEHHKRIVRQVNDNFGPMTIEQKCWVITRGNLNQRDHWCGDHSECDRYVHFVKCVLGERKYIPTHSYFTDYDHEAYPPGISKIARVLLSAFVLSPYFQNITSATALNPRSSVVESFFHDMNAWMPKIYSFGHAAYKRGVICVKLVRNELTRFGQKTSGRIESTPTHTEGIMKARMERRPAKMKWRVKTYRMAFTRSWRVQAQAAKSDEEIAGRIEQRTEFLKRWEAQKVIVMGGGVASMPGFDEAKSSILQTCPHRVEGGKLAYCSEHGVIRVPAADRKKWGEGFAYTLRNPFPFKDGGGVLPMAMASEAAEAAAEADEAAVEEDAEHAAMVEQEEEMAEPPPASPAKVRDKRQRRGVNRYG